MSTALPPSGALAITNPKTIGPASIAPTVKPEGYPYPTHILQNRPALFASPLLCPGFTDILAPSNTVTLHKSNIP